MSFDWGSIFEKFGTKKVSHTDKSKSAYVLNKEQLEALRAAGIKPSEERPGNPFPIALFLESGETVQATFYFSERKGANRIPEPRLGREFITSWLQEGDEVVIGSIGGQIFAAKAVPEDATTVAVAESVAAIATDDTRQKLIQKAKLKSGKPARKQVTRSDFVRSADVVMGAIARSGGSCEMPNCNAELFLRDGDIPYLEVHHVTPLSEDGEDSLENAATLCPRCHRELHHGKNRAELRKILAAHIRFIS